MAEEESALTVYLLYMAEHGFPLTSSMAMGFAWAVPIRSGTQDRFNADIRPGKHWWRSFRSCHPELSLRTADNLERSRANALTRDVVDSYFDCLKMRVKDRREKEAAEMKQTRKEEREPLKRLKKEQERERKRKEREEKKRQSKSRQGKRKGKKRRRSSGEEEPHNEGDDDSHHHQTLSRTRTIRALIRYEDGSDVESDESNTVCIICNAREPPIAASMVF